MSHGYCVHTNRYKKSWMIQQLMEIGQQAYLPLLCEQRKVRRQLKWVVEPLFHSNSYDRSQGGYIEINSLFFSPGEKLQVLEGSFQEIRALFQQELKVEERVVVLQEILSSLVRAELPRPYVGKSSTTY